ncbi:MAG: Signal transduction histidine kinase [Candidatus Saccharibacteria bacterium]|nr:Signal transduction histidine kinase [Candidatus Saccharibacteria bacterium]
MKIVLLEPDKVLANTYRQALTQAGHKVVMCATAQAAIFAADELKPDLVIMELQLTSHSGIEFLYEFRSYDDWTAVPVIVLTNVPAGEFSDCWSLLRDQLGVQGYHYKPLTSLRTLLRAVSAVNPVTV